MDWENVEFETAEDRLREKEPLTREEYESKIEDLERQLRNLQDGINQLLKRVENMADDVHHFPGG